MVFALVFVSLLTWTMPVLALDVRNQVAGQDNNVWRTVRNSNNTVTVFRNDSTAGVPQPGGLLLSVPALTRLGSTIYIIGRGLADRIYCNRISSPYTSWMGWQELGGFTVDAPAAVSRLGNVFAAVRGTDNGLYTRTITNCGGSWSFSGWFTNSTPQMLSDDAGVRVYFQTPDGEFHRFQIGISGAPLVRSFGIDQELHGAMMVENNGFLVGYGEVAHPLLAFGDAATPVLLNGTCNIAPLNGMNRGDSFTSVCYGGQSGTGDMLVNFRFSANPFGEGSYSWRSCVVGSSSTDTNAACDFRVPIGFFPSMTQTTSVNLRAKFQVHSASHNASSSSDSSLSFRLSSTISQMGTSNEVEIHMVPYHNNTGGCVTQVDHDATGRHIYFFTPSCIGVPDVASGQSRFYNVNLKDYILSKISDHFQAANGRHDDLPTYLPQFWHIIWGVGVVAGRFNQDQFGVTVDDVHLEVRF